MPSIVLLTACLLYTSRLYKEDITGSIAHAKMLGKQGIIEAHEAEKIVQGLEGILADIEAGKVHFLSLIHIFPGEEAA